MNEDINRVRDGLVWIWETYDNEGHSKTAKYAKYALDRIDYLELQLADAQSLVKRHEDALEWLSTSEYAIGNDGLYYLVMVYEYCNHSGINSYTTPLAALEAAKEGK